MKSGEMVGFRNIRSLCIRVAKDFTGIADGLPADTSLLLLGSPGAGKTTLLRDLIRKISNRQNGFISVVDERGELFPGSFFDTGPRTDVLSLCPKTIGIDTVLRTMGPRYIAVDEVSTPGECEALTNAARCGVHLIATVHARDVSDLKSKKLFRNLLQTELFDTCVTLQQDKSWRLERISL